MRIIKIAGIFILLVIVVSCLDVFFSRRYGFSLGIRTTGNATKLYDNATLVVISMPATSQGIPGVSYQAIGVLIPQKQDYLLKSLTSGQTVALHSSHPLFVSADRQYLKVGDENISLGTWSMVDASERGWEPLRDDVQTALDGVDSRNSEVSFSIADHHPQQFSPVMLEGDWFIHVVYNQGPTKDLYYGRGKVQQAGWAPDQKSIYINNDGRILNVSLK